MSLISTQHKFSQLTPIRYLQFNSKDTSTLDRGGGVGRKVPAAYNSKTFNDNEMKFGGVVKDH